MQTKFIIDIYNKYSPADKSSARYVFKFLQQEWAIKEYPFINGKLMRPLLIDEDEDANEQFQIHDTLEEARQYIAEQRKRNMGLFQ